ncbi:phosphoribosylformylglycinamidine cyclo-ligase [Candidatus Kapabacteria bacterium]|nr:phosphoribosylformylglycinamidine cyclo-ligase [Candidatus Kapabacteria bacterium]
MASYKDAGVDISASEQMLDSVKGSIKETHNKNVLSDIGLFGGFYKADFKDYEKPILVSSVDGVGTKIMVAVKSGIYSTVGQDLVNHCVNDILCCGAKPLFFLDYYATGKLDSKNGADIIRGFATACKENNCALIGGETAEMPGLYQKDDFDLSGSIVGIVDENKSINGSRISKGDIMIGLQSSGLHTNGYSLARHVLFNNFEIDHHFEERGTTLASELLAIHKSYLQEVHPLVLSEHLTGISHITGGGIEGNTNRILSGDLKMKIDWDSWERPFIFQLIQAVGDVEESEMRHVFNLGVGMILIAKKENVDLILENTKIHNPFVMGEIA